MIGSENANASGRLPALLLVSLLLGLSPAHAGAGLAPVERSDDELLVLELRLGREVLNDALLAYLGPEGLLVPLGEVMAALDLPISVDPGSATAEGWFLQENRRFHLDLERREVRVAGRPAELDDRRIELHADDIYVDTTLLARWIPVDFEIRLQRAQILVRSRERLPIEQQLERRRKWHRARPGGDLREEDRYLRQPLSYRWLDWPAIDHTVSWSLQRDRRGAERAALQSHLLATGDLMRMSAELNLGFAADGIPTSRLVMGRRDPGGGLLGPLRATSLRFGDLFTPQRPLVSRERRARGMEISSFPLNRPQEFDRTSLRGDALPGWEVELYRNEELIDFQAVGGEGHYEFTSIPLYFGLNLLRLVFHGPQGQKREKVERVLIGQDLIRAGETHYRFSFQESARGLLAQDAGDLAPAERPDGDAARGRPRYFLELERGLRRDLSASFRLQSLSLGDGRHTYASAGLLGTRRGVLAQARWVADATGGWAGRLAAEARLPRVDLRFEHRHFSDFQSEETEDEPLAGRSVLEVSSRLGTRRRPLLLTLAAERDQLLDGSRLLLSGRLGVQLQRFSWSHSLRFEEQQRPQGDRRRLDGDLLLTTRGRRLRMRAGLRYSLEPRPELRDFQWTTSWRFQDRLTTRWSVRHSLSEELSDTYQAGLSWRFEKFAVGFDASYDDRGSMRSGISLSYSLGREPYSGGWHARSRSLATQGLAAARVFLDRNFNRRFDGGDQPLEGVRLAAGGGGPSVRTDQRGVAFVTGLAPDQHTDLGIKIESLEDPYWIPDRPGVGLVTRPGRVAEVDFPVFLTGEVDGVVYLRRGESLEAVAKVELELIDPRGEVRYRATSAYDGFYLFDRIVPGRYRLRVHPGQAARLGLLPPPEREIVLAMGDTVLSGIDLTLER